MSHSENSGLGDVEGGGRSSVGGVGVKFFVGAQIPYFDFGISAAGGHVASVAVDGEGGDGVALVAEEFDEVFAAGGGPEGDGSVGVAEVYYGVEGVLAHDVAGSKFGAVLGDEFSGGCVLVLEHAAVSDGGWSWIRIQLFWYWYWYWF